MREGILLSTAAQGEDDSFAAYLGTVPRDVSPALIGEEGMEAIAGVARLLPGALALQTFGFECNLSRAEPAADFALLVRSGTKGLSLVKGLPPDAREHPVWQQVRGFMETWADRESTLSLALNHACLEFDISTATGYPPTPSVFCGYRLQAAQNDDLTTPLIERQIEATRQAFEILTGRPIASAVLERVQSCFELLPPSAGEVFQLGAMIARETDAFRMCVSFSDRSQIVPYLDRLEWDGERDRLLELLGQLEGKVDRLALNLDVSEVVQPRIGLECALTQGESAQAQHWAPFLDYLVGSEIALEPKCRALLGYPGHLDIRQDGARWPASLRRAAEFLGAAAISVFQHGISHVKLVLEPGQPIEAKAYLSVMHLWVRPELLSRAPRRNGGG